MIPDAADTLEKRLARIEALLAASTEASERLAAIEASLESVKGALGRGIGAVLLNVTDLPDDQIKHWVFTSMLRPTETPNESEK